MKAARQVNRLCRFVWGMICFLGLIATVQPDQWNPTATFDFSARTLEDGSETFETLIRGRDGLFIFGCIRKPPGEGPFPGVILIHGGLGGNPAGTRNIALKSTPASALLKHGYAVLSSDYRARDWITEYRDIVSAYEFFKHQSYVRADAIAIMGGSHGGKLTLDVVTHIQPQAAVPCAGLYDLAGLYEHCLTSEYHQALMQRPQGSAASFFMKEVAEQLGGTPAQVPDMYRTHSGINRIRNIETPLLVVHGMQDVSVPVSFANNLVDKLREQGKPVETYYPEKGPHGFYWGFSSQGRFGVKYNSEENEVFLERLLAFLGKHLSPDQP